MNRVARIAVFGTILAGTNFAGAAPAQMGRQQGLLEPNVAGESQLAALPHMTRELARGIIERRPFRSITELNAYLGAKLNKDQFKELYGKMFIHINLNAASKEEMLLIPGLGNRMVHEFEEYRPYKSLAQFRKEIGKYVNEAEVARLEQYVFLPLNLNTASDEDLSGIPGLGRRMLREFKEYRPYGNIESFRREIGKYVSEKEVARLERYITLE